MVVVCLILVVMAGAMVTECKVRFEDITLLGCDIAPNEAAIFVAAGVARNSKTNRPKQVEEAPVLLVACASTRSPTPFYTRTSRAFDSWTYSLRCIHVDMRALFAM